jgi:hypothetical protein
VEASESLDSYESPRLSVRFLSFNDPPRPLWNAVVPDRSSSRLHRLLQS